MQIANGKAAVFQATGKDLEIRTYPLTKPPKGSVLLALKRSGICGTDIHIIEGRLAIPPAFIPGHEFIGQVKAIGGRDVKDGLGNSLKAGDLVIACVALPCGKCFNCRNGETASCTSFGVSNIKDPDIAPHFFGGFADFLCQPAKACVHIGAGVSLDAAASLPCAGPTCIRAFDFAGGLSRGELVAVQGTGPVGLFAIAWAAKAGCTVVAIGSGSNPKRLELAKKLGAKLVLDYRATKPEERLAKVRDLAAKLQRGDGADVVIEASGSPQAIPEGMNLVRTLGRYIVPGQYSSSGSVAIQPELITFKAIKIVGSGQYKLADIKTYLAFLRKHKDIQRLFEQTISHRFSVADANEAWRSVSQGKCVKAVFSDES